MCQPPARVEQTVAPIFHYADVMCEWPASFAKSAAAHCKLAGALCQLAATLLQCVGACFQSAGGVLQSSGGVLQEAVMNKFKHLANLPSFGIVFARPRWAARRHDALEALTHGGLRTKRQGAATADFVDGVFLCFG